MPEHIATLIVILTIATAIFVLAKKHIEGIVQPQEFILWRNAWFIITLIAFLASNFWIYILATGLYVNYVVKKVENRIAFFYAILFAVPVISVRMGPLIYIDYVVLLSIVILLPMFFSVKYRKDAQRFGRTIPDWLVIILITLMTILEMRGTTFTDAGRNGIGYFLSIFLPYFIASRIVDFNHLKVAIIAFSLAGLIAGSLAIFESFDQWLLYNPLPNALHADFNLGSYLGRGTNLRALSSLGHPLILGLLMMIIFGFYLFVAPLIENKWMRRLCWLAVLGGLFAPLSRGAWVSTLILLFIYIAIGPKMIKRMTVAVFFSMLAASSLPFIPGGEKLINSLPFIGKVDQFNVDYREVLFEKGLQIVARKPLFGVDEPSLEPEMEDMVQGEGIVDIVNSYLNIVLGYGIPALVLYVGFFLLAIWRVFKSRKRIKDKNSDEYRCGTALIATMLAVLIAIFSTSSIGAIPTIIYSLAGLLYAYARVIDIKYKKKFSWQQTTTATSGNI
jgi:O-antigen ligase